MSAPDGGTSPLAPTPSQTVGPYLSIGMAPLSRPALVPADAPGAVTVEGRLLDGAGAPVPDGVLEIWQPGRRGPDGGFGRCLTDGQGRFRFVVPAPGIGAGIGATGPSGDAAGDPAGSPAGDPSGDIAGSPASAPHLDVLVFARGLTRWLRTRCYFPGQPANDTDPVLSGMPAARRATLVAEPVPGTEATVRFDVHLQGDGETVFFAP